MFGQKSKSSGKCTDWLKDFLPADLASTDTSGGESPIKKLKVFLLIILPDDE